MKSDSCKNRNDTAGQSIDIEWHVCRGDTSVQILHQQQEFMCETGHAPESCPDRIIFASMFNDRINWESQKVQTNVLLKRMMWLFTQQESDLVIGVAVVQNRKRAGNGMKNDHLITSTLQTVNGQTGTHFKNESDNHRRLLNMILACNQLCFSP